MSVQRGRRASGTAVAAMAVFVSAVAGVGDRPDATATTVTSIRSVVPARVLETRHGFDTIDGQYDGVGRRPADSTLELLVGGRGGVPADAQAVMLNVTAVSPGSDGFLTLWPCGNPRPVASNVNFSTGQVVANAVLTKLGAAGTVCIYSSSPTDVVADVNGFVPAGGSFGTVVPARLLETRPEFDTHDGQYDGLGPITGGRTLRLPVAGRGGVPVDAGAAMLNVTAVLPEDDGFLTVFPCGVPRPLASSVNFRAGEVVPNAVLSRIGPDGDVCIHTTSRTHLVVDVSGHVPSDRSLGTLVPARVLETRAGFRTVDQLHQGSGRLPARTVYELPVTGRGGVPADATAVMLNVTAVVPSAPGFLTVFPCGEPRPHASNVNYLRGEVSPNAVLAKVGGGGAVCVYTEAATDLVVDVNSFVPDPTSTSPPVSDPDACDVSYIAPILDGTIGAARLAPGGPWMLAPGDAMFADRTNTAEEFADRLAFDCAVRIAQQAGGAERLALVAWNDLRHAYVIQATDEPATPFAREARFQLFVEQPWGEWISNQFIWAASLSGGESIVIGSEDYSIGLVAKSWHSAVPRFDDLPTSNDAEVHAIDVLRNAGARNVSVAEDAHGSPFGVVQMNTSDALLVLAGVAPADVFDPLVPLVDEVTTYHVVDGVDVRVSMGKELEFTDLIDVGFSCHDYGWRLSSSLGTPYEMLAFATDVIRSHDC